MKNFVKRSSPTILTFLGAAGVVATAIMAIKATPKATRLIENRRVEKSISLGQGSESTFGELTKKEIIQTTWKCYIPTALIGLSTIACILGANVMSKRNQASLASAYVMLSESYRQYRNTAKSVYGNDADSKIKAQMAKNVYVHTDGFSLYDSDADPEEKILCYDLFSQRYFRTTLAAILNAQYHINRNLSLRGYTSINEFYEFLGIDGVENGAEIGWSMDILTDEGIMWLDFDNSFTTMDDGMECCIISALSDPNKFDGELDV